MVESSLSITDGIEWLKQEHQLIRQLFDSWHNSHIQHERNAIVEKFISEICIHASIEERYVYPLIEEKVRGRYGKLLSDRNYLDDQLNKEMLQFLMDNVNELKNDNERNMFNKVVEKFITIETDHLKQEEDDVFPLLKLALTSQELKEMCDNLKNGRTSAPTHPHPMSPMKFGSKILHPIAGAFDKIMDNMGMGLNQHLDLPPLTETIEESVSTQAKPLLEFDTPTTIGNVESKQMTDVPLTTLQEPKQKQPIYVENESIFDTPSNL
ncbi:predicted protein [Naegleria gruberi]|uniref:Predicted protein n=1 Tax=Naegleria gruberi TaxID=5762 RepID=D2V2W1_NAEGR|nr:uncharacterized protein NAEGRDRAFT_46265 [Naegleria gruberi]EFC48965.1 predicted protein [Naegleria gruberi]|eukprot:XP_002681709.1 predicted protein [Naegleria gruberi strain NEG-M]